MPYPAVEMFTLRVIVSPGVKNCIRGQSVRIYPAAKGNKILYIATNTYQLLPVVKVHVKLTFSLHQGMSNTNEGAIRVDRAEVPTNSKIVVINAKSGVW